MDTLRTQSGFNVKMDVPEDSLNDKVGFVVLSCRTPTLCVVHLSSLCHVIVTLSGAWLGARSVLIGIGR